MFYVCKVVFDNVHCVVKSLFRVSVFRLVTRTINVIVFMSGIFDLFDVTCKQHHRPASNPFLNGTKTVTLTVRVNEAY